MSDDTERAHAEAVADAWVATVETHRRIYGREVLVSGLADLIARERAAARAEALEEAARACDSERAENESREARYRERESKAVPLGDRRFNGAAQVIGYYAASAGNCARRIRALKSKP